MNPASICDLDSDYLPFEDRYDTVTLFGLSWSRVAAAPDVSFLPGNCGINSKHGLFYNTVEILKSIQQGLEGHLWVYPWHDMINKRSHNKDQ